MENLTGSELEKKQDPIVVQDTQEKEPQKSAEEMLKQEIKEGLKETRRPAAGLFLSGLSAGLDLGFSVLVMAVLLTLDQGALTPLVKEILLALAYTVGFILVILGNSELFTEHTTLAVFPLLNGDSSVGEMLRLWVLVIVANLVGGAIVAALLAFAGPGLGIVDPQVFGEMARRVVEHPWYMLLISGVLAGWLMGLVSWLITGARETISQVTLIVLITGIIGFAHLHHAITSSIEVFTAMFAGQGISLAQYSNFLLWATLGNIIGGVFIVALIKYGHIIQSGSSPESVSLKK